MTIVAALLKVALVASLVGGGTAPVKVTVTAPGHTPKINTHWNYSVSVTRGGMPVAGKLTMQIVDPIGGAHLVEFGKNTKTISNWPFKGVFRDYIIWPPSARGIPLKLRVTVVVSKAKHVVTYAVAPRA